MAQQIGPITGFDPAIKSDFNAWVGLKRLTQYLRILTFEKR
jgi:hypothetical protein